MAPRSAPLLTVPFGSVATSLGERQTAILRLLGRLEVLATAWVATMIFPDTSVRKCQEQLAQLHEQGLVWRQRTTLTHIDMTTTQARSTRPAPPRAPYVYGLTPEGQNYLASSDAEPHDDALKLLQVRDRRSPKINEATLKHDLLVAGWCTSVLAEVRKCPLLESVACQVEYVSARDAQGKELQRFDALLELRFNPKQISGLRMGWMIPWDDGQPAAPHNRTLRIALEVDRGTEQLSRLYDKGQMYKHLTTSGHYQKTLQGEPLVVFLTPGGRRPAQIATEWRDAWPEGPGVISTPKSASDPVRGALWGTYYTLKDNPSQTTTLLASVGLDRMTWERLTAAWSPHSSVSEPRKTKEDDRE